MSTTAENKRFVLEHFPDARTLTKNRYQYIVSKSFPGKTIGSGETYSTAVETAAAAVREYLEDHAVQIIRKEIIINYLPIDTIILQMQKFKEKYPNAKDYLMIFDEHKDEDLICCTCELVCSDVETPEERAYRLDKEIALRQRMIAQKNAQIEKLKKELEDLKK